MSRVPGQVKASDCPGPTARLDARATPQVLWAHESGGIVTISLNGEPHDLETPLSVSALLATLDIDSRRVAVELNSEVVRRARYGETIVGAGDQVEIVNFVGGG